MKPLFCCIISLLTIGTACAQSENAEPTVKRNTIFIELGGPAAFYSINYDRLLRTSSPIQLSIQGGVHARWWEGGAVQIPVTFNGFVGKKNHHFNVGTGLAYSYGNEGIIYRATSEEGERYTRFGAIDLIGRVGYRLQQPQGGFFLSAAYTPFMTVYTNNPLEESIGGWINWFGIGLGHTF